MAGKDAATAAWAAFFAAFPDYRNSFGLMRLDGGLVAVAGRSDCSDGRLAGPALWPARLAGEKIAEWRVYEDTPENRGLLGLS